MGTKDYLSKESDILNANTSKQHISMDELGKGAIDFFNDSDISTEEKNHLFKDLSKCYFDFLEKSKGRD